MLRRSSLERLFESNLSAVHVMRGSVGVHQFFTKLLWSGHVFYTNRLFLKVGMKTKIPRDQNKVIEVQWKMYKKELLKTFFAGWLNDGGEEKVPCTTRTRAVRGLEAICRVCNVAVADFFEIPGEVPV